ncbi:L,D-transpeptidase family protein [Thermoproteota archaeon]
MNREIIVKISNQKLYLLKKAQILKVYPVSTSRFGIGSKSGSSKTPLGSHRISNKIGKNAPLGAIFIKRRNTGKIAKIRKRTSDLSQDLITTRIMRLEGLKSGLNKGSGIDTYQRCIYIHGTPDEGLIGKSASHGCIRMKNRDIIDLFNLVKRNTLVCIEK